MEKKEETQSSDNGTRARFTWGEEDVEIKKQTQP